MSHDCLNVVKWRQYSITYFSVNFIERAILDLEKIWVLTHQTFTPYLGMADIEREQITQEVGQYIERTERFKLA